MFRTLNAVSKPALACALTLALFLPLTGAHAEGFKMLYSFKGSLDGALPLAGLLADKAGNLYGTTQEGGTHCRHGCGTAFKLAPDGTETVLVSFAPGTGSNPAAGLIADRAGNLYGTTPYGSKNVDGGNVFKLKLDGVKTQLHAFTGGTDGATPVAGLLADKAGNFYGTTYYGGGTCSWSGRGCGTVFKLTRDRQEQVLYSFKGGNDGLSPMGTLVSDSAGNLYGTTFNGDGALDCPFGGTACGTVFKLAPDGTETVLHDFTNGSDGANPEAGLIWDKAGNLYGTTYNGGGTGAGCPRQFGCGTIFKVAPDGTETVLYAFAGGNDGANPAAALVLDSAGNLYGTTSAGGGTGCTTNLTIGCGTVFKLAPDGTETLLHAFTASDGRAPVAGVVYIKGYLYGTTELGGTGGFGCSYGCGTVFRIRK